MHLNAEQRFAIREIKRANPKMRYREIAAIFDITASTVGSVLNQNYIRKPEPAQKPVIHFSPVKVSDSFIRAIPRDRLMAGNGRCARPIP